MELFKNPIELNQSIVNCNYSVTLYEEYVLLILFYDIELQKAFNRTDFYSHYVITKEYNKVSYLIKKLNGSKITKDDLFNINNYWAQISLVSINIFQNFNITNPILHNCYFKHNNSLENSKIRYIKTEDLTLNFIIIDTLWYQYIRIVNINLSHLTKTIIDLFNLQKNTNLIVVNNKEYKYVTFKDKFLCRHDWARNLNKSKLIIYAN